MRRRSLGILVACALLLGSVARAAAPELEINGRDFYGMLYVDGGDVYGPLDVIGPLLLGSDFVLDNYDVVLRKATFRYTPAGAAAPTHGSVTGCAKRGTAVYAPIRALAKEVGASYESQSEMVRVAYPPVSAARPATKTPIPVVTVGSPGSAPVALAPTTPDEAIQAARQSNLAAFTGRGAIKRIEVYNPISPDPADAIPRTDVAGLKIYVAGLSAKDQAWISMWPVRDPAGEPTFRKRVAGFRGQELEEGSFFVRLPLQLETGWHSVVIDLNHKDRVEYRFITY